MTLPRGGGDKGLWGPWGLRTPRLLTLGVRLDFDLCMTAGLLGRLWSPREDKFPVDVADLRRYTSGFSGCCTGLGILDNQGRSGEGGWCLGPAMIPSATCLMSKLHLSHRLRLTGGLSSSGVVKGLPPRALAP